MPIEVFTAGQQLTAQQLMLLANMLPTPQVATANVSSAVSGTMYRVQPAGGGTVTITLPPPTLGTVVGMKLDSASGTAILNRNATESLYGFDTLTVTSGSIVRGAPSVSLSIPDSYVVVIADGTNWHEYGSLVTVPWKIYDYTFGSNGQPFQIPASGNIPTGYSTLQLDLFIRSTTSAAADNLAMRFNNDSTNTSYYSQYTYSAGASAAGANTIAQTYFSVGSFAGATAPAGAFDHWRIVIPNYTNSTAVQTYSGVGGALTTLSTGGSYSENSHGVYYHAAALTSVTLWPFATSALFAAGSRCTATLLP